MRSLGQFAQQEELSEMIAEFDVNGESGMGTEHAVAGVVFKNFTFNSLIFSW